MFRTWRRFVFILLLVAGSLDARTRIHLPPPPPPQDIFTNANANDVRTEHLSLDLTVDFEAERIRGSATHRIVNSIGTRQMIVDTRGLDILSIEIDGARTQWNLGPSTTKGQALTIDITPMTRFVRIDYETRPTSTALRWFEPSQTMGRVKHALVTQGQPDHARSWIPVQDSPAVRMTWDASVRVPEGLLALMSGRNPQEVKPDGIYTFEQRRSVPAYLIVLAAGPLVFRALDDRTGIYAEPELIDDAVYEMQFLPEMFRTAENILGPYPWDRYDLLFAPHFGGGMENTELNFIGPDLISGNQPDPVIPNGLIAHELAHSWVGDMVTCATWSDTWLNEGFATYYEKRILESMAGAERAELGYYFDRSAYESYLATPRDARLSTLHRTFVGTEGPGNAFNTVAYQKGGIFLKMLDDSLGRTGFDAMIEDYLRRHAYGWVDERAFLNALDTALSTQPPSLAPSLLTDRWVYQGGLPPNVTAPTRSRIWDRVAIQSSAFRSGTPALQLSRSGWTSLEEGLFLQQVTDLISGRLADLDQAFGYSDQHTPPIAWLIGIAKTLDPSRLPVLERYLMRGTNNSLAIWYELGLTARGRSYAIDLYNRARPFYSDNSRSYIEQMLRISSPSEVPVEVWTGKAAA